MRPAPDCEDKPKQVIDDAKYRRPRVAEDHEQDIKADEQRANVVPLELIGRADLEKGF